MARIAVGGFQHETHSFTSHRADFAYFVEHRDRPPFVKGQAVLESLRGGSYGLSGFLEAMRPEDEVIPLAWASGGAGGVVTDDAFERIVGELVAALSAAMPVDGVYLDLHGAMVNESFDDAEAELLRRVRACVGPQVPIIISLDYHANISPEMVAHTDATLVCRTYPHVDRAETGAEAARILHTLLARGVPAGRAIRKTQFLLPLDFQCTLTEPSRSVVEWRPSGPGELVSVAYAAGFAPSDTPWCGPAMVIHAWSQQAADAAADEYLRFVAEREAQFNATLWNTQEGVKEALDRAAKASRPIVIADTQDNVGAGGAGDTTGIIDALIQADAQGVLAGYFCDPVVAQAAIAKGAGGEIDVELGGRHGPEGVRPIARRFEVVRCIDGPFKLTGSVNGGVVADLGPMALIRAGGVQIAVTSRKVQAFDLAPFHRLDVDPAAQRILVLKSSVHFRADFGPLAESVMTVLSPGFYDPDNAHYPYRRLREGVRYLPQGKAHRAP